MADGSALAQLGEIVGQAAQTVRTARPRSMERKALQDYVTDIDRRLEDEIREALQKAFPGAAVLGEESVQEGEAVPSGAFLVDPLDGTLNYISGLSFSAISVALLDADETVLAAVADIWRGRVYGAAAGQGAFRDGERLPRLDGAEPAEIIALSSGVMERLMERPAAFMALRRLGKIRNLGAQALQLCLVADGTLAANLSEEARLWDDAAGRLIVTEAGGCYAAAVADADRRIASTCQRSLAVHPALLKRVQAVVADGLRF
ncbi:inositol monophosphatase family protein [Acuticoccus mangrovi]|uniref:Inositol monophosphatase family protein n=1 Tax=Acuticoccus mangrovi TaxID=2796142 RepID=A0A934IU38_9HYPH|nr:inositol monophosphatase family protein [Acuticoccus mangrovi]MBJ3778775.1 inositol monophosphatase family protein [Acuticoccus mangrovi]